MGATNFVNGTIVTPVFLNKIFNTGGGHVHDGADSDGHAQKIAAANVVPQTNGASPDGVISSISNTTGYTANSATIVFQKIGRQVIARIPAISFSPNNGDNQVALNGTFAAFGPAPGSSVFVPCVFNAGGTLGNLTHGYLEFTSTSQINVWWLSSGYLIPLTGNHMPAVFAGLLQQDVAFLQG